MLDGRRYLPLDIACSDSALGRQIKVHEKAVFFATANLGAEYSGTQSMDRALVDRFQPVEIDYPSEEMETQILAKRTNIDKKTAEKVVKIAVNIRNEAKKAELSSAISVRHTLEIAELITDGFGIKDALMNIILPLFSSEGSSDANERSRVISMISAY